MSVMDSNVVDNINKALDNNDTHSAVSAIKAYLEDIKKLPLTIAVTGESGSGKSTFVNAFRGIDDCEKGAAPTDVVETTMKPESYPHPRYPNVTLWDLPGIGTTRFPAKEYLKFVKFEKFDFFIILSAVRFKENDAMLAKEIRKMGKKFFFVRSKIDDSLNAAKRSQKTDYNEEKTLQKIREDCIKGLEAQGVASPHVFLCAQFDLRLYDFDKLQETMKRELPSHKRDVLILALPNIFKSNISKKKEVFRSQIAYNVLLSVLGGAVRIPGLSSALDLSILNEAVNTYIYGFGLDDESLEKLSIKTKKSVEDLKAVMTSEFVGKAITAERVASIIPLYVRIIRWIPLVGLPLATTSSYHSTYCLLNDALDSLSVDGEHVLVEALAKPSTR